MEHIKNILEDRQRSLFSNPAQKGSSEWGAFNTVSDDKVDMYRVTVPVKPQPRYTNVVRIRRFRTPHSVFPKHAH